MDSVLHLLPARGLDQSILLPVLVGMMVMLALTETYGWGFVGVVVPGYLASVLAIVSRCNLPVAFALVWITNPLTIPPMFYFAYRLGAWLLGMDVEIDSIELSCPSGHVLSSENASKCPICHVTCNIMRCVCLMCVPCGVARSWR